MNKILEIKNLKKSYTTSGTVTNVLHGLNFEIYENEFVAIMGPSGSGKTTLLNLLSTIDTPTSGEILINNKSIINQSDKELTKIRQEEIGFIFQDYNLLDTLSVKENIILPLAIRKEKVNVIEQKVQTITNKLAIDNILNSYPYQISGGQKQRSAVARALITNPSIIYADEPTGALDSKTALNLLESLQTLNEDKLATILMVTHDVFAASFCNRVLLMKDGELVTEINKGNNTRVDFYKQITQTVAVLGGN